MGIVIILLAVLLVIILLPSGKEKKPAGRVRDSGKGQKKKPAHKTQAVLSASKRGGGDRKKSKNKRTGWADTNKIPHKNHPAYFRRTSTVNTRDIEYVTFTHTGGKVDFEKNRKDIPLEEHDTAPTIELEHKIDPNDPREEKSHVVWRVYEGKRDCLGPGASKYNLHKDDVAKVEAVFNNAPRYIVDGKTVRKKGDTPAKTNPDGKKDK